MDYGYFSTDGAVVHRYRPQDQVPRTLCGVDRASGTGEYLDINEDELRAAGYAKRPCDPCFIDEVDMAALAGTITHGDLMEPKMRAAYVRGRQQINRAVEQVLANFGRCTDGRAETPTPAPVQQLMSALSHLSDFQEVSEDAAANARIDKMKVPLMQELEVLATRAEMRG